MSNTLLTPTAITREALRVLHTECAFIKNVDKQHDKNTTFGGQKRGATLQIRLPNQYTVRSDWAINVQETVQQKVDLVVATVRGVDMYVTDAELAQSIDDFSKNFIRPAVSRLAAEVDYLSYLASLPYIYNLVGTAGTTPSAALTYLQAGQKLSDYLTPKANRKLIINNAAEAATVNALAGLFNPVGKVSKQFTEGDMMGRALGFDWFASQNVPNLTTGTRVGTTLVNATLTVEGGTTIVIKGMTNATDTVVAGDVFTVAGVYAVNPETKQTLPFLQQFVVTTLATATSNVATCTVSPAIYSTGALQNVDAQPAANAVVTFVGSASTSYPQNLAFHPDAITFATAKLEMPSDVNFKAQEVMDGISMRILRQYDINSATYPLRIDVLCGSVVQRPTMACRIIG